MRSVLFANGQVGDEATTWLLNHFRDDLVALITIEDSPIAQQGIDRDLKTFTYSNDESLKDWLKSNVEHFDLGLLIWWPRILPPELIGLASVGFFNTHPSFLPFNRGKHYNFWCLVEEAPFGVTIHRALPEVDAGPIVSQFEIPYTWEDDGETLYFKATKAMVELVKETYPLLRSGEFEERPQILTEGSFHYGLEIEEASHIDLDRTYQARDLLNRLRARTFSGHPACSFVDAGERFEVRVDIRRVT